MFRKLLILALCLSTPHTWAETTRTFTTGIDHSTGDYGGTTETEITYIPLIGKIQTDVGYLKLALPYISITSANNVVRGIGRVRTTSTTQVTSQSGLGDIIASAGYTFFESDELLFDLVGNIKFGTADVAKNLGTGENDYSAHIDGFYTVEKTTILATAGYKIVGEADNMSVNNIAYGTLGLSQKYTDKISFGAMLDAAQSSSALTPGTRELSIFATRKLSQTLKAQINLLKGFSDSSPDFGAGLMLTVIQ